MTTIIDQLEMMVGELGPSYQEHKFTINNKVYTYNGPETNETVVLLQKLTEMQSNSQQLDRSQVGQLYEKYKKKEKEWKLNKSLLDGNFSVGFNEIIKTIVYWSAFFSVLGESINIKNDPRLERDSTRRSIAQYMPLYAFLYTFFSQLFQQIHYKIIWVILFICLIFIPSLVMVGHHFDLFSGQFHFSGDYIGLALCITSIAIFINSFLNKVFFYLIKKVSNELIATLFNCSLCIFVSYFILFKIIAFVLLLKTNSINFIVNCIADLIAPTMFMQLFFISIFILKRVFFVSPKSLIKDLEYLKTKQQTDQRVIDQYLNYQINYQVVNWFYRTNFDKKAQILISICYATLEIYFYINLILELQSPIIDFEQVINFAFLLFALPIYMLIGIYIQDSKSSNYKIYLYIPIILGATLSVICIELWSVLKDNSYLGNISRLIGISPLLITVVWLILRFFRKIRRVQKMFTFTISCYFFLFPIGILLTLSDVYEDISLQTATIILVSIGCVPIVLLIIYYIFIGIIYAIKLPQQAPKQNFEAYKYLNLKDYARLVNAIFFICSFYALSYFAINEPETATGTKKGTIIGLLVIHVFLFIQTNIALVYQVKEINDAPVNNSENEIQFYQDPPTLVSVGGSVISFVILLPLSLILDATESINETTFNALLSCSIGIPLTFAYFYFQIKTKRDSFLYQNFLHPFFVFIIWIFIIGPIGVIIPIFADMYQNESSKFAMFAQLSVAYTIIIIILSVTVSAVFYSILLNKEHLEMKKKEVLQVAMKILAINGVFSTEETCVMVFLRYIQEGDPIRLKRNLIENGDPVTIWKETIEDKGVTYKKQLVSKKDYEQKYKLKLIEESKKKFFLLKKKETLKLLNNTENLIKEEEIKKMADKLNEGFLAKVTNVIYQIIFCKYGFYELEDIDKQRKEFEADQKRRTDLEKDYNQKKNVRQRNDKRHSIIQENANIESDYKDFYLQLKNKQKDRGERFWLAVYIQFQNSLSQVLEMLELDRNDILLGKQYSSFKIVGEEEDFTMSIQDFSLFLYVQFYETDEITFSDLLQKNAVKYFKMFVANHKKELSKIFCKPNPDTAFHRFDLNNYKPMEREKLLTFDEAYENLEQNLKNQQPGIQLPHDRQIQIWKFCKRLHEIIWLFPIKYTQKLMGFIQTSLFPKIELPPILESHKNEGWEVVANELSDTIVQECNRFEDKMKDQQAELKMQITNILAIFFKFYDTYSLASLAFKPQVGWEEENQTFDPVQSVDYSIIWNEYNFFFSLALLMSIVYILLGLKASQQIKSNTFGYDERNNIATWQHRNFWISKTISFLSGQFIFVMKTFIDSVICDYTAYPYTLVRQPNVECMSDTHFVYIVFAILGCGIYYPLTTYLQPTFQYMDNSLDLKYQSSYVVILSQGKLLVLGLSSVFSNLEAKAYLYQMLFSSFVMIILIIFHIKMFPCYVKWFNFVDFGLLCFLFYFYFGAFLVMVSGNSLVGAYFLLVVGVITISVLGYFLYKKYKQHQENNSDRVVPIQPKDTEGTSIIQPIA